MKRFLRNNGLSLVLTGLFLLFWLGQAVMGWRVFNSEQSSWSQPRLDFTEYLGSAHFWQATGENWESEFLQMGIYVIFTCFLYQKGSAESKDPDQPEEPLPAGAGFLARNSLSLALLALFLVSFAIHAFGGWMKSNHERMRQGQSPEFFSEFITGAEFWFQSFQNWQSEFLAVLAIVTLSIFLRQHGSPESKKVDAPNSATGGG